ncbi:hypothetical protein [Subtercola sp. YIM 133946]|uniref:hypothetical protein n=1 Tax=Subtercola sp. YIM 133946 TaxID=3118909 RepID=UPI002F947E33
MELSFRTRQLRKFCIRPEVDFMAQDDVEDLVVRLADLMAADNLSGLPWGVAIEDSMPGKVFIDVNHRWKIAGRLDHVPQPSHHGGMLSTRVRIDELRRRDNNG